MPKLPMVTAKTIIQFLNYLGFELKRQRGSHNGRTATVPDHSGEDLGRGILKKILNDIEISREEFFDWLQKRKQ